MQRNKISKNSTRPETLNTEYSWLPSSMSCKGVKTTTWIHRCVSLRSCCVQPNWQPVKAPCLLSCQLIHHLSLRFFGWPNPETDGSNQAPLFPPQSRDNLPNPQQSSSELDYALFIAGYFVSTQTADSLVKPYCALLPFVTKRLFSQIFTCSCLMT